MEIQNRMELRFLGLSRNESFARVCAGAFASQLDPTLEQISDIKTAVSEAVTNATIHAYRGKAGEVVLRAWLGDGKIVIEIEDFGVGIEDVELAMKPYYTTSSSEDRSGMGFSLMQTFMDDVSVVSSPGRGTKVTLTKQLKG